MIVSTDIEKALVKTQYPLHDKNSQKTMKRGQLAQLDEEFLQKIARANIIQNENLNAFPLR